jgi:RHS repeat-associated protein
LFAAFLFRERRRGPDGLSSRLWVGIERPGGRNELQPPGLGFDQSRFTTRSARPFSPNTTFSLGNFSAFDDGAAQTRTANAVNEISAISGGWITPSYDDAGNLVSGPKPDSGTTPVHYSYDAWNRLLEVRADDSGEPADLIAKYQYDGTNRRVEKILSGASHVHYFYNQEWQLLEERFVDSQGATVASNQYVWSARYIDSPIVRFHDGNGDGDLLDAADDTRYYAGDANYNVTATIDAATTDVVERYVYTAYGVPTVYDSAWANPTAPTTDGPRYCGYFLDGETALYQVRNRYYDRDLSTFISRDPLEYEAGDANLYRYVGNNQSHSATRPGSIDISSRTDFTGGSSLNNGPSIRMGAHMCQATLHWITRVLGFPLDRRTMGAPPIRIGVPPAQVPTARGRCTHTTQI